MDDIHTEEKAVYFINQRSAIILLIVTSTNSSNSTIYKKGI